MTLKIGPKQAKMAQNSPKRVIWARFGSKWAILDPQKGVILEALSGAFLGEKWSKSGPKSGLYTDFRVRFISTAALKTGQVLGQLLHLFLAKNGSKWGRFWTPKWAILTPFGPLLETPF